MTDVSHAGVSVIIPAHNEERVLARCLTSVRDNLGELPAQLIVVCNACTDRTAEVARQFDGVHVLELAVQSKAAALNAGDRIARFFPRLYLDADVEFLSGGPDQMRRQLEHGGIQCVTPTTVYATEGCSRLVRAFYQIWTQLPYRTNIPVGGAYMLSEEARRRFADFPAVTADDLFVQSLFSVDERARDGGAVLRVHPPRTVRGLLAIRTRTYRGNQELATAGAVPSRGARPLADLLAVASRSPANALAGVVYLAVNVVAKGLARWKGIVGSSAWERDQSSRTGAEDRTVPEAG